MSYALVKIYENKVYKTEIEAMQRAADVLQDSPRKTIQIAKLTHVVDAVIVVEVTGRLS